MYVNDMILREQNRHTMKTLTGGMEFSQKGGFEYTPFFIVSIHSLLSNVNFDVNIAKIQDLFSLICPTKIARRQLLFGLISRDKRLCTKVEMSIIQIIKIDEFEVTILDILQLSEFFHQYKSLSLSRKVLGLEVKPNYLSYIANIQLHQI